MFDRYAHVRPAKLIPVLKRPWDRIDIINVRENTEDSYAAIERMVSDAVAQCLAVITWPGSYRIADGAFPWARANDRTKVFRVHEANIMKRTDEDLVGDPMEFLGRGCPHCGEVLDPVVLHTRTDPAAPAAGRVRRSVAYRINWRKGTGICVV